MKKKEKKQKADSSQTNQAGNNNWGKIQELKRDAKHQQRDVDDLANQSDAETAGKSSKMRWINFQNKTGNSYKQSPDCSVEQ